LRHRNQPCEEDIVELLRPADCVWQCSQFAELSMRTQLMKGAFRRFLAERADKHGDEDAAGTLLLDGILNDNIQQVVEAVSHGAPVNGYVEVSEYKVLGCAIMRTSDSQEMRPLHLACEHGNVEIVKVLLEHSADPNANSGTRNSQKTPLHFAAVHGRADLLLVLLQHGADPKITDGFDKSAAKCLPSTASRDLHDLLK